jgi:hypothetical protein
MISDQKAVPVKPVVFPMNPAHSPSAGPGLIWNVHVDRVPSPGSVAREFTAPHLGPASELGSEYDRFSVAGG